MNIWLRKRNKYRSRAQKIYNELLEDQYVSCWNHLIKNPLGNYVDVINEIEELLRSFDEDYNVIKGY